MDGCMDGWVGGCRYVHMYVCMSVNVCVYVCMYIGMYIQMDGWMVIDISMHALICTFNEFLQLWLCDYLVLTYHIKEPLLLIGKSRLCGGSRFPISLFEWAFTICLTPYNCK